MNMHKLLEDFIAKYFKEKLMPKIREDAAHMEEAYGEGRHLNHGENDRYQISAFGFQTEFMMRYMLLAFGAVSVFLLIVAVGVNPGAMEGAAIFAVFFALCLVLWGICRLHRGFIVYTKDWLYLSRGKQRQEFAMKDLEAVKVSGTLTLIFQTAPGSKLSLRVPLEGSAYVDFARFIEKYYPKIVSVVSEDAWKKAIKRHGSAWGNQM